MIQMYESELKRVNPGITNIRYDLADLFAFIDKFYDVSCLKYFIIFSSNRFDPKTKFYKPCTKDWLKNRIYKYFQNQSR